MKTDKNGLNKQKTQPSTIAIYVVLVLISLFVLYPLVYVVVAAFTPGNSISGVGVIPFENGFTLEHFKYLFEQTDYLRWFANTFIIAVGTALMTVVVCTMSAYLFSRVRFPGRKTMLVTFLVLQVFPSFVGMIAMYVILWRIGGLDTLWGMVLIYTAGNVPYNTWLVKNYIDASPLAVDEAARIDGANTFQLFRHVTIPTIRPILTFLTITTFAGPWMDYIFPKMALRSSEMQTLALGLYSFVTDKKDLYTTFAGGALLVAIPFVIFFCIGQKQIISSLSGAVKE